MAKNCVSLNPSTFSSSWRCGGYHTLFGRWSAKKERFYCRKSSCATCGPVMKNLRRFKIALCLEDLSSGPHLFIAKLNLQNKMLSNFIAREKRGPYVCIRLRNGHAVLISTRKMGRKKPIRAHKSKLLRTYLPVWLNQMRQGVRGFSFPNEVTAVWSALIDPYRNRSATTHRLHLAGLTSKEINMFWRLCYRKPKGKGGFCLATVPGRRSIRWGSQTPIQRALFLAKECRRGAKIFKPGKELITRMHLLTLLKARKAQLQKNVFGLKFYLKQLKMLSSVHHVLKP